MKPPKHQDHSFLVLWWASSDPFYQTFDVKSEADSLAMGTNGVVVEVIGQDITFGSITDFYRRKDDGSPMPFKHVEAG